ncbi:DNA polymerase I [Klebsiella pneumoniae]|uniref:DNA polymerase I n=1 Tax=Klebsiella pneumoniae TaxID=573 RepID=A0A2X3D3M8_KLEPN|nr:DNA polymerase I [Klebsiella pneumoniae]
MAVHLLIVDALNLIRRIHAVQGSPCVDTCLHALEQLIVHSQPPTQWRCSMMRIAPTAGATSACRSTKPAARRCRRRWWPRCRRCGPPSNSGGSAAGPRRAAKRTISPATLAVKVAQAGHQATIVSTDKGYCQLLSPTIRIRDYFQKRWLTPPSSPASSASPRSSWRITGAGGDQQLEGAGRGGHWTQKRRPAAERVSGPGGAVRPPGRGPGEVRKKLAAHQEMAFTCREVARLQTDLQLDGNLQQLRLTR